MHYGITELGQHWSRWYWLAACWHKAFTWTKVDLSSIRHQWNFIEIWSLSFGKMHLIMLYPTWQPFCFSFHVLTHSPLGDLIKILKIKFPHATFPSNNLQILIEIALQGFLKNSSQHWLRLWLDAVRQQAIIWANVDQDPCHHMPSLGHKALSYSY